MHIYCNALKLSKIFRQSWKGNLCENGSIYMSRVKTLMENDFTNLTGKISIYEMAPHTATNIDEPHDWDAVESLILYHRNLHKAES